MKRKIEVTFEVRTTVEVDCPEGERLDWVVLANRENITKEAREALLREGVENQLCWEHLVWNDADYKEFDMSEIGFEI